MKRKKIFIAALVAAALALAPMSMRSQVAIKGGTWGNFNNVDSYAHLGSGLVLLTVAGLVYAFVKRRKAKAS